MLLLDNNAGKDIPRLLRWIKVTIWSILSALIRLST